MNNKEIIKTLENNTKKLVGKKIKDVRTTRTWDDEEIDEMVITFEDDSKFEISAGPEKGCPECDEDGSLNDYLNFHFTLM